MLALIITVCGKKKQKISKHENGKLLEFSMQSMSWFDSLHLRF